MTFLTFLKLLLAPSRILVRSYRLIKLMVIIAKQSSLIEWSRIVFTIFKQALLHIVQSLHIFCRGRENMVLLAYFQLETLLVQSKGGRCSL